MRKWKIILIVMLVMIPLASAFFISSEGGVSNSKGLFTVIRSFFTSGACVESWTASSSCLVNDTTQKTYTDSNSCGSTDLLPADNGTYTGFCNYCSYNLVVTDVTACTQYDGNTTHNVTVFDENWVTCCSVTGLDTDCYNDDTQSINKTYYEEAVCPLRLNMELVAIAILLVGGMFWLIYMAGTLNTQNDSGETVPLNSFIKMILYALAGFTFFIAIQMAYGFATANSLAAVIQQTLLTQYRLVIYLGIILLFLLLFGIFGNAAM